MGEQQRVEILKMLYRGAHVLILDEPTAVLAPQEADGLFAALRAMSAEGRVDRLHQPQARRGDGRSPTASPCCAGAASPPPDIAAGGTTTAELARLMVGREVLVSLERTPRRARAPWCWPSTG